MITAGDWTVLGALLASWLLYFAVHSLLASLRLKAWAAAHVPAVMPWFRLIYNLIAVLGLLPIFYLLLFCPTPIVWAWHGFAAWLANALALDPDRMTALQAQADKDGLAEEVVARLKGTRPESLTFASTEMPLASARTAFSYEDSGSDSADPYAYGLVEALLGMPAASGKNTP